jgi:hypothetical protein
MMKQKTNKKALFFLILLGIFGFACTKIVIKYKNGEIDVLEPIAEEKEVSKPQITYSDDGVITMTTEDDSAYYEVLPESQTVDITDEYQQVLGETSCDDYANQFDIKRLCEDSSTEGTRELVANGGDEYEGSHSSGDVSVSTDLEIKLVHVTFPSVLANGSKTVKDNRKDITTTDPVYKSFGDELTAEYGDRFKAPSEVQEGLSFDAGKGVGKESFLVFAENKITSAIQAISNVIGKYVAEKEDQEPYCSECGEDIQPSYFNAKPSNDVGTYLDSMMQIPGKDPVVASESYCLPRSSSMQEYIKKGYTNLCGDDSAANPMATFLGVVKSFFKNDDWTDCNTLTLKEIINGESISESDRCYSVEDLVVEMTSLFGSVENCEKGVCTNTYMTRRFRSTLSPTEIGGYTAAGSSSKDSLRYSVLTPCTIEVTRKDGDPFEDADPVETYCVWDVSPILGYYRLLANEKIPQQKDFPQTFEEYWNLVKKTL